MTEWEKAQNGYLYDANYDTELLEARARCADLCFEFNNCRPSDTAGQKHLLDKILGHVGKNPVITAPFYCDYVLPGVTIGSNTVIAAGSVVNRDIPSGVIAAGNPCRVIREITEADKHKYPIFDEGI